MIEEIKTQIPLVGSGNSQDFNYKDHVVSNESIDGDLKKYLSGKFKRGLGIGIPEFDRYFLLKENQLLASTGKKGGGKTTITQILYLMWAICHKFTCVVAYQENDDWHVKFNIISMLLGLELREIEKLHALDDVLFLKALEWVNKNYIFIDVKTIKEATEVTKGIIRSGVNVHTLILDPANSFLSGFSDTGNERKDHLVTAIEVLDFAKKNCSVHISQHPIMSVQRDKDKEVTSYDAENGVYLNKAHLTYTINRSKGTSENRIAVDNERTRHMGGGETHPDEPIIIEWRSTGIDLYSDGIWIKDVVQVLRRKHNPLCEDFHKNKQETKDKVNLPLLRPKDAF